MDFRKIREKGFLALFLCVFDERLSRILNVGSSGELCGAGPVGSRLCLSHTLVSQGVNSYYLNHIYSKLLSTYPILVGLGPHKTDMIIDKISICSFWIWCYLTGRFVMPLIFPDIQISNWLSACIISKKNRFSAPEILVFRTFDEGGVLITSTSSLYGSTKLVVINLNVTFKVDNHKLLNNHNM